jgi:hypothetical protein
VTSDVTLNLTILAVIAFAYFAGGAATAGYMRRTLGEDWANSDTPAIMAPIVWPAFWFGWFAWRAFIKPVVPIIVGIYRVSAGMTWSAPDDDLGGAP